MCIRDSMWADGDAYEPYVGRWSRLVALPFLDWLGVPPGRRWLDVGCGTGALTEAILQVADPRSVRGIDAAEGYVAFARARITDGRAEFQVGDAHALPVEAANFDAVVSGLALNFVAQPAQAIVEMAHAVKKGCPVAAYVWDYGGRVQFMRHFWNAAAALDPSAAALDEGRRFPLCNPEPLAELFQSVGLVDVAVRPLDIWTEFTDFDDYWLPFLGGQGPAPSYTTVSYTHLDVYKRQVLFPPGSQFAKAMRSLSPLLNCTRIWASDFTEFRPLLQILLKPPQHIFQPRHPPVCPAAAADAVGLAGQQQQLRIDPQPAQGDEHLLPLLPVSYTHLARGGMRSQATTLAMKSRLRRRWSNRAGSMVGRL